MLDLHVHLYWKTGIYILYGVQYSFSISKRKLTIKPTIRRQLYQLFLARCNLTIVNNKLSPLLMNTFISQTIVDATRNIFVRSGFPFFLSKSFSSTLHSVTSRLVSPCVEWLTQINNFNPIQARWVWLLAESGESMQGEKFPRLTWIPEERSHLWRLTWPGFPSRPAGKLSLLLLLFLFFNVLAHP